MIVKPNTYARYASKQGSAEVLVINETLDQYLVGNIELSMTWLKHNLHNLILSPLTSYSTHSQSFTKDFLNNLLYHNYQTVEYRDLSELRSLVKMNLMLGLPIVDSKLNLLI
jgi:hypothetical protein